MMHLKYIELLEKRIAQLETLVNNNDAVKEPEKKLEETKEAKSSSDNKDGKEEDKADDKKEVIESQRLLLKPPLSN